LNDDYLYLYVDLLGERTRRGVMKRRKGEKIVELHGLWKYISINGHFATSPCDYFKLQMTFATKILIVALNKLH
jgi:hypothetical protein